MEKLWSKILSSMLILSVMLCMLCVPVSAASTRKCYTISSGNTSVYSDTELTSKYGTIYGSDEVTVLGVYSSYSEVRYPVSGGGTKTGYIPTGAILTSTSGHSCRAGARITTYKRPGGASYGYIDKNDAVVVLGRSGNYTQVKYPVSGGYKYAFVTANNAQRYLTGQSGGGDNYADISYGTYVLRSALNNNKVVDANGLKPVTNGTNIELCVFNGGMNQQYDIIHVESGWYKIVCKWGNKVLDVWGAVAGNEVNVVLHDWNAGPNQLWRFIPVGNGYYYIQNKMGYYLDVWNNRTVDGTNIQTYQLNGGNNQKWKLDKVSANNPSSRSDVVSYMKEMAAVAWTPRTSFRHWSYGMANGSNHIWTAGETYYGVPYSQASRNTSLEQFRANMSGNQYVGPSGQSSYLGSDCSSAISMAYQKAKSNFPITNTIGLYPIKGLTKKVGSYHDYNLTSNSICSRNGMSVMKSCYRSLQNGDILLNTGHVMMVTGMGNNYVNVTHQTVYNSSLHSTWRVDEKKTFDTLYREGYIPVTLASW